MKQKTFKAKREIIKQAIGIEVTLNLEIKLQKYIFQQNMTIRKPEMRPFEPLLGYEYAYVCHNERTQKGDIYSKKQEYKTSN